MRRMMREHNQQGADGEDVEPISVTVAHAAALIGISKSYAYDLVRSGELPSARIGSRIVVPLAQLRTKVADQASGSVTR